jgi:hypothetical protein
MNEFFLLLEVEDNKTISGSGQHDQEDTYRPVKQFTSPRTHIQYDAFGNKRAHPIKIPNGLKGSRPNAQLNLRVSVLYSLLGTKINKMFSFLIWKNLSWCDQIMHRLVQQLLIIDH